MKLFLPLFCLVSQLGFAATWSGILVDARCFESAQDNHNLAKPDGAKLALDSTGNVQAAELVRQGVKRSPLSVT